MSRKILCTLIVSIFSIQLFSQTTKVTNCGIFSFFYPSSFSPSDVKKEPGFVMALESDKCFISASTMDLLVEGFSIWDDELIGGFKNLQTPEVKIFKTEKILVNTKSGKRKSFRMQSNVQSKGKEEFVVQYSFIHKEYLINVQFVSYENNHMDCLEYAENLIRGIKFN